MSEREVNDSNDPRSILVNKISGLMNNPALKPSDRKYLAQLTKEYQELTGEAIGTLNLVGSKPAKKESSKKKSFRDGNLN